MLQLGPPLAAAAEEPPKIMVTPVVGVEREPSLEGHVKLVHAFRASFGERVLSADQVVEAQKASRVWPKNLTTKEGVARLAQQAGAQRAVVPVASKRGLTVFVYAVMGERATRQVSVSGVNPSRLSPEDAAKVVKQVDRRARALLLEPSAPELAINLGRISIEEGGQAPAAAFGALNVEVNSGPPSDDIVEEERREAELLAARLAARKRMPALRLNAGLGLGFRDLIVSGGAARLVVPVSSGALPTISLDLTVAPLRLVPSLNRHAYGDLFLDVYFARALAGADYEGRDISYDEDSLLGRLRYGVPLMIHRYSPRLGVGLGGGWERSELGSGVAAPSTRYLFGEGLVWAQQALYGPYATLDAVLALRQSAGSREAVVIQPAWYGALWLSGRLASYLSVRTGIRHTVFKGWRDASFAIEDRRTTWEVQLGGVF